MSVNSSVLLAATSIGKRFGGVQALTDVSFSIERGEIYGLIGPNGAGKTSLFNVLTGIYSPDSGNFTFDGAPLDRLKPNQVAERGIARTFQNIRLFQNLSALENVIIDRDLKKQIHPEGRPVAGGFISSYFGEREDPFSGEEAYHKGVDFAGSAGANVMAVAAGVVTWAGNRTGYGNLVEINHGDGYITRYAHNQRTLVSVGQTVKRGDPVALMGSTGRSTGPHVHFEVVRNGRQVDPLSFIGRK